VAEARQRATFYELQAANRRNSFLLIVGFLVLVAFLGWGLDTFFLGIVLGEGNPLAIPFFTLFALAFGLLHAGVSWFGGAREVLHSTMARPPRADDPLEVQFVNVVEEMAIAAGLPPPKAYVVPDDDPNAFAVGRSPEHAAIAVTRGLLETLDRDELQGVVSHEMAHVRNLDIRTMTLVTALLGAAGLMSDVARRGMYTGGGRRGRSNDSGGSGGGAMAILFILWMLIAILAPILTRLMAMAVSRSREYLADASGAELTRNPLGLASALRKLAAAHRPTHLITQGSDHLCGTHPPIARRIALLETMAGVGAPPGA
jgi:heat shock protein HtpX